MKLRSQARQLECLASKTQFPREVTSYFVTVRDRVAILTFYVVNNDCLEFLTHRTAKLLGMAKSAGFDADVWKMKVVISSGLVREFVFPTTLLEMAARDLKPGACQADFLLAIATLLKETR